MKKVYLFIVFCVGFSFSLIAQVINFPDVNFKARLLQANSGNEIALHLNGLYGRVDTNFDNQIQVNEAIDISTLDLRSSNIYSIVGINNFTNLSDLNCDDNNISAINITSLNILYSFSCSNNQLTALELHNLNTLWAVGCSNNNLVQLNLTQLPNLSTVYCNHNNITSLDVNDFSLLQTLECSYNLIQNLTIQNLATFNSLRCDNNLLTSLNLINLPLLGDLYCENNQLSSLNILNSNYLRAINCSNNLFTSLNLNNQVNPLLFLTCDNNFLSFIDSSFLPINLSGLSCRSNLITNINLSGMNNIRVLVCENNQINDLDVGNLDFLDFLSCNNNALVNLNVKNGSYETTLEFANNPNLMNLCSDDFQISNVQNLVNQYGYTNCNITSDCVLSNSKFEFLDDVVLSPNPAQNIINIQIKNEIELSSISIYNALGQLVLLIPNAKETNSIDVSSLRIGCYFIQILSDKGSSSSQFIKE